MSRSSLDMPTLSGPVLQRAIPKPFGITAADEQEEESGFVCVQRKAALLDVGEFGEDRAGPEGTTEALSEERSGL